MKKNYDKTDRSELLVNYPFNDIYVPRERDYYKYSDIFPLRKINFEGIKFSAPNNPDAYLKILYGNYMELPPLDKRKPTHNNKIILSKDIDASNLIEEYVNYRNKYFYYSSKFYYKLYVFFRQLKSNGWKNVNDEIIKPFINRKIQNARKKKNTNS
jgi:hypothetical protein